MVGVKVGWLTGVQVQAALRCPQGRGGITIWAGIINGIIVHPWRVSEEIQINAETYIAILKDQLEPWFKPLRLAFRRMMMFMRKNAAYHSAKKTVSIFNS